MVSYELDLATPGRGVTYEAERELFEVLGGATLERVDLLVLDLDALVLGSDERRLDARAKLFAGASTVTVSMPCAS